MQKLVKTNSKQIVNTAYDFLFKSKITERRELLGNGCGISKETGLMDEDEEDFICGI